MLISFIVLATTLLMGGLLLIWLMVPGFRSWMERPKYRVLEWEKKHPLVK